MARPRKGPWRRGEKGHWYTTIGREIIKLADKSKSYEDAFDEYIKFLSCRENIRPNQLTINARFYRFLDWCEQHRSETTYNFYKRYLGSFEANVRECYDLTHQRAESHELAAQPQRAHSAYFQCMPRSIGGTHLAARSLG